MTVVSGYLGAGKTTLINHILAQDHGLRLLIMVNDFGAINIDANLLAARDEDTIALTNGCVCCTMGADLFLAISDAIERRPRPDHLIIEASGVADPRQIANAAIAEPELAYGGIVTVVDGLTIAELGADPLIGAQVHHQISCADLVYVSKCRTLPRTSDLPTSPSTHILLGQDGIDIMQLLAMDPAPMAHQTAAHPRYVNWQGFCDFAVDPVTLRQELRRRPSGLFRVKGVLPGCDGTALEVQVVGQNIEIKRTNTPPTGGLVGIGLQAATDKTAIDHWWANCIKGNRLDR